MQLTRLPDENQLGFISENLRLATSDSSILMKLPVRLTQEPYEPQLTEAQLDQSPFLSLSRRGYDFKVMEVGQKEQVNIQISNVGRNRLDIYKLESNCDCLQFEVGSTELEQGESANLRITFDATGRMGYERKTLAIFSNDPRKPTQVLVFRAHVK